MSSKTFNNLGFQRVKISLYLRQNLNCCLDILNWHYKPFLCLRMDGIIMKTLMSVAVQEAKQGYSEGGVPVGAVIAEENGDIISQGHNMHHQNGDPTSHGETQCVRNAGRRRDWSSLTLVTTLSPCSMCSGMAVLLNFRRVIVGDRKSFDGKTKWLEEAGIHVVFLDDPECIQLMDKMLLERPELWAEDIGK